MSGSTTDLRLARAHWLAERLIAWPRGGLAPGLDPFDLDWTLHWSPAGAIDVTAPEPVAWETAALQPLPGGLPEDLPERFQHHTDMVALGVPEDVDVAQVLRGQVVLAANRASGALVVATSLQIAGVLDDIYASAASARLGATWRRGVPTLRVWAPTARDVSLLLWDADAPWIRSRPNIP